MERDTIKDRSDQKNVSPVNEELALHALQQAVDVGVREFYVCPSGRNAPLVVALKREKSLHIRYWYEERSCAFFALGRSRATKKPVAVVITSGTAVGELLPAVMEAYYSGVPLVLITADRPTRFRGTGAPQSCEQVDIFGQYAASCDLAQWAQTRPVHVNVCFEEPLDHTYEGYPPLQVNEDHPSTSPYNTFSDDALLLDRFLNHVSHPLVIVNRLALESQEPVCTFLQQLRAPVILESVSGLREHPSLQPFHITCTQKLWSAAKEAHYPIDGILRIGGVPTLRAWRDLEAKQGELHTFSISDFPFSGLSWGEMITVSLPTFFTKYALNKSFDQKQFRPWLTSDRASRFQLEKEFAKSPSTEPALFHQLSKHIPEGSLIYLGNSLPIREWDLAATFEDKGFDVYASRGLNGIDGQVSTFLGLCQPNRENWAILGDLTTLYDFAGFWASGQLPDISFTIVVVNNGGGKIFSKMFPHEEFQNSHRYTFEPIAKMWGLDYERWTTIPESPNKGKQRLIELTPL